MYIEVLLGLIVARTVEAAVTAGDARSAWEVAKDAVVGGAMLHGVIRGAIICVRHKHRKGIQE